MRKLGLFVCTMFLGVTLRAYAEESLPTKSFTYKKTKQGDLEIIVH